MPILIINYSAGSLNFANFKYRITKPDWLQQRI